MSRFRKQYRWLFRWSIRLAVVVVLLFALQVSVLAFPQMLVSNGAQAGMVKLYYDGPEQPGMSELAADVDERLRLSGFYDSSQTFRVVYCQSDGLFALFTRLAMVHSEVQGFAISYFGNSYVSAPRVSELSQRTGGRPRYAVWEGSPAHTIAHEIGHLIVTGRIGRRAWMNLPHWKQEGPPEYIANIGRIRHDSSATLSRRIETLNDYDSWGGYDRWDRIHYEAGLLVEYLLEVRGLTIDEILANGVTKEQTLSDLMAWYGEQEIAD